MSRDEYNDGFNNPYNGFNDYDNQNGFYQNMSSNNQNAQVDIGNNIQYEQANWSLLDQTSYGGNNMADFMAEEYNHYDNNGYMFDNYVNNEYSNSNIDFANMGEPYKSPKNKEVSLSFISNKLNDNVEQELLYDNIGNVNVFNDNRKPKNDSYNKTSYNSGYDNDNYDNYYDGNYEDEYYEDDYYEDDYYEDDFYDDNVKAKNSGSSYKDPGDNKTVAISLKDYKGHDRFETVNDEESVYGRIATDSEYYTRDGYYDAKLLPTQDIVFDDIYVVRNQLFDEEEKMFSFSDIISLGICVAFAVIMAFLIVRYVAQATVVKGHSMEYNFHNKEVVILDKLTYRFSEPKRFDVVVFPVKEDDDYEYYIKRIIGLPGEKVYIDVTKSEIYIDGKKLRTDVFGWEPMLSSRAVQHNDVILGADEYYCMGDNRNYSQDSRALVVGSIKKDDFLGKAIFKISPFSSFGLVDHYYNHEIRSGNKEAYDYNILHK
jgi:signal peptidase I